VGWFIIKSYVVKSLSSLILIIVATIVLPVLANAQNTDGSDLASKQADMSPFYWTLGIIGGCIGVTLAYVSWKKYKGEQRDQRKDQDR